MLRNLIYLLKIKFKGFQKSSGFMDIDVNVNFFYVHRKPSLSGNNIKFLWNWKAPLEDVTFTHTTFQPIKLFEGKKVVKCGH
jgi:hypothetical protein